MNQNKYIEDIKEIKDIMNRSSRFVSLSGLSGISAGIIALTGAYAAFQTVYVGQDYFGYSKAIITSESLATLLLIALSTVILAVVSVIYFTTKETKKRNLKIWDHQTKRLLINLSIPLITGGILCLLMLFKGYIGIVAPLTLIFYGLALVNASKYTLTEIRSLGIIQIILGLIATHFIGFGLLFWAGGFGILHIIYGVMMHLRYRS
jgi:hypothetical protein